MARLPWGELSRHQPSGRPRRAEQTPWSDEEYRDEDSERHDLAIRGIAVCRCQLAREPNRKAADHRSVWLADPSQYRCGDHGDEKDLPDAEIKPGGRDRKRDAGGAAKPP